MAAIFQFFHNGWHWYSISIDTRKTGDPNFGGVGNWKFFHTIDIKEMAAIFQFFHNGWHWYSTLGNPEMKKFCRFSFLNFSIGSVFHVTHPRFRFNIDVWLHLKHFCVVTFLHLENGRHKFSVDSVFQTFPFVQFSPSPIWGSFHHLCVALHKTFMHGHLCVVTFLHQWKAPKKICQNRLTHLCVAMVNCLGNSLSH